MGASKKVNRKVSKKSTAAAGKASAKRRSAATSASPRKGARRDADAGRNFPSSFLWGAATAATQIDGGDLSSDWYAFSRIPGRIAGGQGPETACDHWNRYAEDYQYLRRIGLNAYRFGVDWSRFQPTADAPLDRRALDHLRKMLYELQLVGARPLLTLFHFTLPQWWAERGGFVREENLPDFWRFAEWIVEHVGDLVSDYTTINEPNVYALLSYVDGRWPPGRSGPVGYLESLRVQRNLVRTHFHLYDRIREIHARKGFAAPRISIAKHLRYMAPADPESALDRDRCQSAAYRFNWSFMDCLESGELRRPLGRGEKLHDGAAWDFIGINYYSRDRIAFSWKALGRFGIAIQPVQSAQKTDLGWEIYPEGLYQLLLEVRDRYPDRPIWITENGIADATDQMRADFIRQHLAQTARAMREGARVEAYFHWSLMDNFEWAEGYEPRFGLVAIDYATLKRSLRPSATALSQIIRSGRSPLPSMS
ncbi:MAG: family 1 glycosylhydrolase [Leptospirales bacterium]|nr:family 1 glycosylhydrolase [Leptospirales bacterium]